jgi:drug/metabolite transporter (DMT)-like permease
MKPAFICYFLIMVAGTAGELCVARAMKTFGGAKEFHPAALMRTLLRAMQVGWMWLGLLLMTVAFFALLGMLSVENVSFVVPATALSYGVGALGGKLFLGEQVSPTRWLGVSLVCAGVALVFIGRAA